MKFPLSTLTFKKKKLKIKLKKMFFVDFLKKKTSKIKLNINKAL